MAKRRQIFNLSQLPDGIAGGADNFTQLLDTPNSYIGQAGKSLRVNLAETALEYYTPSEVGSNISFLDLTDTPSNYTGSGLQLLRVNSLTNAVEFDPNTYVVDTRSILTNNGITGGGNLTADRTLGLTGQALALHNLVTNGYIVRTGAGTVTARSITSGTGISITNGDGISGNTVITLNAELGDLNNVNLTGLAANQTIYYNGTSFVTGSYTTGTVTSVATTTGLTGGTITTSGTLGFDIPWGDNRYHNRLSLINTASEFQFIGNFEGIQVRANTSGSTGYPSSLGSAVAYYTGSNDATSAMSRVFAFYRIYGQNRVFFGIPGSSGSNYLATWTELYHTGNLNISTLGGLSDSTTITINGTTSSLSTNPSFSVGTVTSIATGTGITGGTITSSGTISLTGQALSFHNLSTNGLVYRNGATIGTRSIVGSTFITVSNGDGLSGNPTISLGTLNLDDLSNVILTTPASGQVLQYNGTNWINATVTGGGGGTVTEIIAGTGLSGGTITTTGTIAVIYGTTAGTSAQGNDSRFHNAVTLGISNGLSLTTQELSLALATTTTAGAMSSSDKIKLDGLSNYSHPTQTAIDTGTLTGASVISRVNVNTLGHTTVVSTRTLTASDIGAESSFSKGDLVASTGISFSGTATGRLVNTGSLTITNTDRGSSQNIFKNIANSAGTNQFNATSNNDTIRFAGSGATSVSFDPTTKTVTISSTDNVGDFYGFWRIAASGTAGNSTVASLDTVNFIAGSNVTITRTVRDITISATDTNTTYSAGTGLNLSGTTFNNTGVTSLAANNPISVNTSTGAVTISHLNSGVTAGTYNNITVNAAGHATSGSNQPYVTSSAITGYIPKMSGSTTIDNSRIYQNSDKIGVFTINPDYIFHITNTTAWSTSNLEFVVEQVNTSRYATNNVIAGPTGASLAAFNSGYAESGGSNWAGRSGVYINNSIIGQSTANKTFNVWIGTKTIIRSLEGGQTAIGQFDPTRWLDIGGDLRIRTVVSGSGEVLTVDGSGNVFKQTAAQIVSAGGGIIGTPTLQQVTSAGNQTSNSIIVGATGNISGLGATFQAWGNIETNGQYYSTLPNTAGLGWARGLSYHTVSGTRLGGFFAYTGNSGTQTLERFSLAFGTSPWNSGTGLHIHSSGRISMGSTTDNGEGRLQINGGDLDIITNTTINNAGGIRIQNTNTEAYAGLRFVTTSNTTAGFLLHRTGGNIGGIYTASGITLVADTGDLNLATRNTGGVIRFYTSGTNQKAILDASGNFEVIAGLETGDPVGTTTLPWKLGRALTSGTATPNRWIRVQIGNDYYDLLAVYRGTI